MLSILYRLHFLQMHIQQLVYQWYKYAWLYHCNMFLLNLRTGIFMVRKFCLTSFSFCFIPSLTLITNMTVQELIPEFVFPQGVQLPFHSPVENVEHGSEDITSGNHGSPQNVTSRPHWTVCGWSTLPFFFFFVVATVAWILQLHIGEPWMWLSETYPGLDLLLYRKRNCLWRMNMMTNLKFSLTF